MPDFWCSGPEILILSLITIVMFGPKNLPQLAEQFAPRVRMELVLRRRDRWSAGHTLLVVAVVGLGSAAVWLSFR